MIGVTIGDYEITRQLGSGGVGDVYLATDLMLERDIAIKFLRPGLGTQADVAARFRSEARTLAQLHHPNIAMIYSLHREDANFAMIMEYVDGMTFAELLLQHGALPLELALPIFFQALDGVGCAHEHGIVHRDLKASNLMLARSGIVKVMDFGIARCLGSGRMTRAGNVVGTAHYMAPEQVQGHDTDLRADIYALALVLYELLTDHLPFEDLTEYEIMRAQIESAPPSPRTWKPDLPEKVEAAILCGLEKDPEYRFQSTAEFREALEGVIPDEELISDALDLGSLVGVRPVESRAPCLAQAETVLDLERVGGGSETLLLVEEPDEPETFGSGSPEAGPTPETPMERPTDRLGSTASSERTAGARPANSGRRSGAGRFRFLVPAAMTGLIALSVGAPVPAPTSTPSAPATFARTPLRSSRPPIRVLDLTPASRTRAPLRPDADSSEIASLATPSSDPAPVQAIPTTHAASEGASEKATPSAPPSQPRVRPKTRRRARKARPRPADKQERPATFQRPSAQDTAGEDVEPDAWVIRTK